VTARRAPLYDIERQRRRAVTIRGATLEDLQAITEIYNEAVLSSVSTFDTEPKTLEQQRVWLAAHGERYPVLVAEEAGRVIGWAGLSAWSERCAYADTAEGSLYVHPEHRGRGIGRRLTEALLEAGRRAGLHTIVARTESGNAASLHLLQSCGFRHIGVMKEVGSKFGRRLDVTLMQLIYPEG
jgi:L-amino acid N-acyltransferase YncA